MRACWSFACVWATVVSLTSLVSTFAWELKDINLIRSNQVGGGNDERLVSWTVCRLEAIYS